MAGSASGKRRVYIQLYRGGADELVFRAHESVVARLARVCAKGQAPESDKGGCWFEVQLRETAAGSVAGVRALLAQVGADERVTHSVHLLTRPGDGRVYARQLNLFGSE